MFDESHAAHVAGEIDDIIHPFDGCERGLFDIQISDDIFSLRMDLVPFGLGFDIDTADFLMSFFQ